MIDILLNIGSFLLDSFKNQAAMDNAQNQNVQEALFKIGDLLESVAHDLEDGVFPHGKCAQMELLSKNLAEALEDDLDEHYLEILKNNLNSAVEIEKLYAYKDDPTQIQKIKVTAGYFKAAAILSHI